TLVARRLDDTAVDRITVANRTVPKAEHVAAELETDAGAVSLAAAESALDRVDVVVTATSAPDHVFEADAFADTGVTLCVDLAQPRDVAPTAEEHVALSDIDDLETVTAAARAAREDAVAAVESLIAEEFDRLMESFKRDRADEAISAMYAAAETVRDEQVEEALTKLEAQGELTDDQRETVESLADALVGQLLAAPTKSLREAAGSDDWETIHTAMQLFDPGFDQFDPSDLPDGVPPGLLAEGGDSGGAGDAGPPGFDPRSGDEVDPEALPDDVPDAVRDRLRDEE
ncbi:MAG: glutamyl-tRNA reductase, partial [Halobaculum sp.]